MGNAIRIAALTLGGVAFAVCWLHVAVPVKSCEELNRLYAPLMQADCGQH